MTAVRRSRLLPLGPDAEVLIALEPGAHFAPHWHAEWSVGAVQEGACRFSCAGRPLRAAAGDVVVMPPHAVHTAGVSPAAFQMVMIYLPAEVAAGLRGWPKDRRPEVMQPVRSDPALAARLSAAVRQGHGQAVLDALADALQAACAGPVHTPVLPQLDARVQRLCEALQQSGERVPDLAGLAAGLGLSREHLHRLFRATLGLTPLQYARLARIAQAKALLRQGQGLAETALACGFVDQAHFSHWFRRCFGVTPGRYGAPAARRGPSE